jgi:hypothetical protein
MKRINAHRGQVTNDNLGGIASLSQRGGPSTVVEGDEGFIFRQTKR